MSVINPERARDGLRVWLLAATALIIGIAIAGSQVREAGAVVGTCSLSASVYEVDEGTFVNVTVLRSNGNTDAVVGYELGGGTSTAPPGTYSPSLGQLDFTGATSSRVQAVTAADNLVIDGPRTVEFQLTDAGTAIDCVIGMPNLAVITIMDDDGPQPATITSLNRHSGSTAGGTQVIITGTGFVPGVTCPAGVTFGGAPVDSCVVDSNTQITAVTDPHAAGVVDVRVDNGNGLSPNTAADDFQFFAGPVVHDVQPSSAPAGQNTPGIVITGEGFTGTSCPSGVEFGLLDAISCMVNGPTQITATAPGQPVSTVNVRVTNGTTSPNTVDDDFSYTGNAPVVTSVNPNTGPLAGGNSVTITGQFFTSPASVNFGGIAGTSVVVAGSGNSLTVTVPQGVALGTVDVQVTTPSGASSTVGIANDYTYTAAPTITGLNPDEGPTGGGTQVLISGTNLFGVTAVTFGGINATAFTINSGILITATSPAHALGLVDVRVNNVSGMSPNVAADDFTYIGGPNITSVTPTGGPVGGGTAVVIKGSGFTGTTAVAFGVIAATSFTVVNDTTINAVSPPQVKGVVHVRVTAPGGTSPQVDADRFTYGEPTVTDVSPDNGPKVGGNFITVTGSNFTGATAVRFGTIASPLFQVTNDGSIVVQVPAGSGTVHVTVTTPAGTSATHDDDRYTYNALPTITSLSPNQGPAAGGNTVIITGSDFTGATQVLFGTKAASGFTVNSSTQITATAPSGSPGGVNVRVVTPLGTSPTGSGATYTYQSLTGTNLYNLSFRWNLVTWAGPNAIDIVVALQSLDGNNQTNSVWEYVTAIYFWQTGANEGWLRFFPVGVNIPGANNLQVLIFGNAYWIALSQAFQWTIPAGP